MPDEPTDAELGIPEELEDGNIRRELRAGRLAQRRERELEAQLASSQREGAMARAGVPLGSPLGDLFAKGYDGDTDPESIKAAFEALGGSTGSGDGAGTGDQGGTGGLSEEELAEQRRIAQLGAGAGDAGAGTQDLADAIKQAKSPEAVMELVEQYGAQAGIGPPRIE